MSTTDVPILGAGESMNINADIGIWWKNVKPGTNGGKHHHITITIRCWDSTATLHETKYSLFATEPPGIFGNMMQVVSGIAITDRKTNTTPFWWIKLRAWLEKAGKP